MNGFLLTAVFHLSVAIFLLGSAWRCFVWLRAPVPLKIPLTPAPTTAGGALRRVAIEAFAFRSLFRADRSLWTAAWLFHLTLGLLLVGHVGGLVAPEFAGRLLGLTSDEFIRQAHVSGSLLGLLAIVTLLWLLVRRLATPQLRYISTSADYLLLALLLLIAVTGMGMRLTAFDVREARAFVAGMHALAPPAESPGLLFTVHLLLVSALLVCAPFSKLAHFGGVFFNPALNQTNTPRERRHGPPAPAGGRLPATGT